MVPAVVFDLDGTLVDTAPDLVTALNTVFTREGLPPVAYAAARNLVGGGARLMIERGLAAERLTLPAAEVDRLCADFIAHYAAHIADGSRPFPGLEAALDELAAHGLRLLVCTNKLEWLTRRLLDALDLSRRFAVICGADTFGLKKPDPELLRRTIARAGSRCEWAVMVGDSIHDIEMARLAGMPVVAVDFGYTEAPIGELKADLVISRFCDLPKAVFGLLRPHGRGTGQTV
jgi:phosphoglycolate phosphatase